MADSKAAGSGAFLGNLGKIYGGYAGGFIVFTLILAVLEQMGVPNKIIGYCFVHQFVSHHRIWIVYQSF